MTYISDALRVTVYNRAEARCEYCHLHERYTIKRHEVDHIYAEKHRGETTEANLCLSCIDCNRHKGSDLCSLDSASGEIVAPYHPRREVWGNHLRFEAGKIEPVSPQGRVTVRLLRLNEEERVLERAALARLGRYP